jgi:hypothetical protein
VLTAVKTVAVAAVETGALLAVTELVTADETGAAVAAVFGGGGICYGSSDRQKQKRQRLSCSFRFLFLFRPSLILGNPQVFTDYFRFRGTHFRIKSFQDKIDLLQNPSSEPSLIQNLEGSTHET